MSSSARRTAGGTKFFTGSVTGGGLAEEAVSVRRKHSHFLQSSAAANEKIRFCYFLCGFFFRFNVIFRVSEMKFYRQHE